MDLRRIFGLLSLISVCWSCTKMGPDPNSDPATVLQKYVQTSFHIKETNERSKLLQYLGGEAHQRLVAWSDDQFRAAFIDSKREFSKLVIREKREISPNKVNITYEVSFRDLNQKDAVKITSRKRVEMERASVEWKISSVRQLSELLEYDEAMAFP